MLHYVQSQLFSTDFLVPMVIEVYAKKILTAVAGTDAITARFIEAELFQLHQYNYSSSSGPSGSDISLPTLPDFGSQSVVRRVLRDLGQLFQIVEAQEEVRLSMSSIDGGY